LRICDMAVCPSPHWRSRTQREQSGSGPEQPDHLTVFKNFFLRRAGTTSGTSESSRQPVIPPAPLTGDVGRDRGDAGRALLFSAGIWRVFGSAPPSAPPSFLAAPPSFLAKGTAALARQLLKLLSSLASTIRRGSRGAKILSPPMVSEGIRTAVAARYRTRRPSGVRIDVASHTPNSSPLKT
jgi:hypothetical protein